MRLARRLSGFLARPLLLLAGLSAIIAPVAAAQPAVAPLATKLAAALREPGVPASSTGVLAIDVERGSVVYQRNASRPLRPASTEKLTVALAALGELGPAFRTETLVLGAGTRRGSIWKGNLVLQGHGDPDLETQDLDALARQIHARGIRRVSGRIVGDASYFDAKRTAPGWKPSYAKIECPLLSALIVDRGVLDGRIADDPTRAAAIAFKRALERAGVRVGNASVTGRAPAGARKLASVASPRLSRIVKQMDTESDNFFAEMLLKLLGAEELGKGTTAAGASVVRRELSERGVPLAGVTIVDGSGLSTKDRMTAFALASILTKAAREPALARSFRASLAVAGVSGTLEDRMEKAPARGRVRAKTGTTAETSALAGYAGSGYVFVLIMNGSPVNAYRARRAQDRFATLLAGAD